MTGTAEARRTMPRVRVDDRPSRVIHLEELAPEMRAYVLELVDVARRNAAVSPPDRAA